MLVWIWRDDLGCLKVAATGRFADVVHDVTELHGNHQNFIKAHPGELSQQEIFSEGRPWVLYLEELHEVLIELSMHQVSDFGPAVPVGVELLKRVNLFLLEFVEVFVYSGALDHIYVGLVFGLIVGIIDRFILLPIVVVEVPNAVGLSALLTAVDAESPEVVATQRLLWRRSVLFHYDQLYSFIHSTSFQSAIQSFTMNLSKF